MSNRISRRLTPARKLLLACAGMVAVAGPFIIGIVNTPRSHAQSQEAELQGLKFEVATIKPSQPGLHNSHINRVPGEGLNVGNVPLKQLVMFAYDVREFQVSGGPGWITSEPFDIVAKPERFEGSAGLQLTDSLARMRARVRALLAERFQLAVHKETKVAPIYALVLAKGGHKLQPAVDASNNHMSTGRGRMTADGSTMELLATTLSNLIGRTVRDQTGLTGKFDFKMEWTPDQGTSVAPGERPEETNTPDISGPSIFTALQEQLGLKLEPAKGPVDVVVIDRVEKPSEN